MKILYLIPHLYNAGGMERVLCQKANWLATHTDWQILIATVEPAPEGSPMSCFPLEKSIRTEELNIGFDADFHAPLLKKYIAHQHKMRVYKQALRELILREKVDLCISLGGKELAFLPEMPCRTMAELHFAKDERLLRIQAHHKGAFWTLLGKMRVRQMEREMKRFERFVVLTEADRRQWAEAGCTNVHVIPNPCSLCGTELPDMPREKEVLAVGRLHSQKGFDRLLDAWKRVADELPDWRLTIVGEGSERPALEERIANSNLRNVTLAGAHAHIECDMRRASLLALTSRYEGLPLAMIEAMWCGLPCVSMDCPHGPSELLANGGGILTPEGDIEAFARALCLLMKNDAQRQEEGNKAQIYAQTEFSDTSIMKRWINLIEA